MLNDVCANMIVRILIFALLKILIEDLTYVRHICLIAEGIMFDTCQIAHVFSLTKLALHISWTHV